MSLYRTGLSRARGLGSAKHGVGNFIAERVSSVALILLTIWLVWVALAVARGGYDEARAILASPVHAAIAILTVVVGLYHAMIGMRVIVEDYIDKPLTKAALLMLNAFVGWGAAAIATVSILKIAFGAGA
ncbi:MAG TPA: succinate dehydrogenase, hydrophobic membrane anchor protein [Caulobacteraceae bacterium]|nr:succinate dehydrogenase, hydrophobic membrane anchor protein [Caulobacteraceae bacterium]